MALVRAHPNIQLLKAEGWSVDIASVLSELGDAVDAFGGHGGLEFPALMRSGAAGLIPAPDCVAVQVAMYEAFAGDNKAAVAVALQLHKEILPLIVFMTHGIPVMWCYGKRLMARRLGLADVHDRPPLMVATAFGWEETELVFADVARAERETLPELQRLLRPVPV